ncbi:spermine synthase [Leptinotarsa decemlineata]|uniref:spermine synthase n=1 Tax=Leptinotarsa decemlineata TaxID=7539 RepID=UPI003D30838E
MAVNTILMDFSLNPNLIKNEKQLNAIATALENILRNFLGNCKHMGSFDLQDGLLKLYHSEPGATINLRIYNNGLLTVNIDFCVDDKQGPVLSNEKCKELQRDILDRVVEVKKAQYLAPLKRGTFMRYYMSSDERLLEYDIDKILFEQNSPYQKVQIVHSKTLGNMLVLDDLQNISEADLIYTETLMARGIEDYKDKEILILGGGDGALLRELLNENPKEVIMLEIDEVVMTACAIYMRSVCGSVLDEYSGDNYKIIVGDCLIFLDQYFKEDRKFDYIFGDLTDVPISKKHSELWTFINKVLKLSFKILKPDGKFMTHLIGSSCIESIETFKSLLKQLEPPVKFTTSEAFVPSFMEKWMFFQAYFDKNKLE